MANQPTPTNNLLTYKICQEYFSHDSTKEVYVPVSEEEFELAIPSLPEFEVVLISLFGVENFAGSPGFTLIYALEKRDCLNIVLLQRQLKDKETTSIAKYFPSACWFEREIQDGFGISFADAFDKRRLFLHEAYPRTFHPLLKSFKNQDLDEMRKSKVGSENYLFKEVKGEGVYQVPVGPVHAGIIEPGHFRFSVIGETISNLEVRMFYKHRGIEKLAEVKIPSDCVNLAETISGDESVANAVAFCMAVETISGITLSERAWSLRTIMLEMERIYSHLADLAGMIVDVGFPLGAVEFSVLREEMLRYNEVFTGSRFMKDIIDIGGLKQNISTKNLMTLENYLNSFRKRLIQATSAIHKKESVIDRLETTGVIRNSLINPLNITGPAARASGVAIDNRVDHPYGIYPLIEIYKRTGENGDVLSRFNVKTAEISDSVDIIQKLIHEVRSGDVNQEIEIKDGYSVAIVEAARGQNFHWVYIKDGVIDRYKVRTASFCNWQAIEHAVMGNIIPDFPLINKSLNLSYAGTDL
jgi:formate hydrogenlyase subunit 5